MKKDSKPLQITSESLPLGNKELILETGRFAFQANGAVLARYGDTVVQATVVSAPPRRELDYFPLQVEYEERLYAGGLIKGSRWVKREGKPSEASILIARLIDRSIRPLFPKDYKQEVQVIITVLSVDGENDPAILGAVATSAALSISDIPWNGPIGILKSGLVKEKSKTPFLINPTHQESEYSEMDLIVSSTKQAVIMLEGEAKEVDEKTLLKGIDFAFVEAQKIIGLIEKLQKKVGKTKQAIVKSEIDEKLVAKIKKEVMPQIAKEIEKEANQGESFGWLDDLRQKQLNRLGEEKGTEVRQAMDEGLKEVLHHLIEKKGKRVDGRGPEEIRTLGMETNILPRTHGSASFRRGKTQALTITTLGSPSLEQLIESAEGEESKRYMHHYNFPPYSVGECGRTGWPSRREIGHGALAERALEPAIPEESEFPYTIRVVSEIMSSNGSTSMAAVCGSTLSLMDAGVPIKTPIAGIAMGKMGKVILSDITGLEDFNGDMDFKVTGSEKGITAIQLDVKALDFDLKLLEKALAQAKKGRLFILGEMLKVMPKTRAKLSRFAPKVKAVKIPVEKIGELIGPGGKTIKEIIAKTGAAIDVEDDGRVLISSPDNKVVEEAKEWVKSLVQEIKAGMTFEGEVKRIEPFGAFVGITPNKQGLVHVSRMSKEFVKDPHQIVKIGQKVSVTVTEIDKMGRINLSMV